MDLFTASLSDVCNLLIDIKKILQDIQSNISDLTSNPMVSEEPPKDDADIQYEMCPKCKGNGYLFGMEISEALKPDQKIDCPDCGGTGLK